MIDTHCHFDFSPFCEDPNIWVSRTQAGGVKHLIVPSVSTQNWPKVIRVADDFPDFYFALGLHPVWIASHQDRDIEKLDLALSTIPEQCVAIGECGLDFVFLNAENDQQRERQKILFRSQLTLAEKYSLPVILHCRNAHHQLLKILNDFPNVTGVLHGFTGSEQLGGEYIRRGFFLGIGGSITYPRANKTRKAVAALPLRMLVLESDAPDMPICGSQGEPNLPERLLIIAQALAELKGVTVNDIITCTTENARACFSRLKFQTINPI